MSLIEDYVYHLWSPLSVCHPFWPLVCVGLPSYTCAAVFLPALLSRCRESWGGCWGVLPAQHPKSLAGTMVLAGTMPCGCVMEWIWLPVWPWGHQWHRDPWGQGQADGRAQGQGTGQTPGSPTTTSLPPSCSEHPRNDPFPPGLKPPRGCRAGFAPKASLRREERLRAAGRATGKTQQSPTSALPIYKPLS